MQLHGIRKLSELLAGTFCPKMKLLIPQSITNRHNTVKKRLKQRIEKHLLKQGWHLLATAGVRTNEASITITVGGQTYKGKSDIFAIAGASDQYTLIIVEVKSSDKISKSIFTIIQASAYALPIYSCLKLPQKCVVTSQNTMRGLEFELTAEHGTIQATLDKNISTNKTLSKHKISDLKVFVAGPNVLEDVTEYSQIIIENLMRIQNGINVNSEIIVPGRWCSYCELYHNGKCNVGLI